MKASHIGIIGKNDFYVWNNKHQKKRRRQIPILRGKYFYGQWRSPLDGSTRSNANSHNRKEKMIPGSLLLNPLDVLPLIVAVYGLPFLLLRAELPHFLRKYPQNGSKIKSTALNVESKSWNSANGLDKAAEIKLIRKAN